MSMLLDYRLFQKPSGATTVTMPEPFDCTMFLNPLTSDLDAEYSEIMIKMRGSKTTRDGEQTILTDSGPKKILSANRWLIHELVEGWESWYTDGPDDKKVPVEYNNEKEKKEKLDVIAGVPDAFDLIVKECRKLAGRYREEEEKNSGS